MAVCKHLSSIQKELGWDYLKDIYAVLDNVEEVKA